MNPDQEFSVKFDGREGLSYEEPGFRLDMGCYYDANARGYMVYVGKMCVDNGRVRKISTEEFERAKLGVRKFLETSKLFGFVFRRNRVDFIDA